MAGVVGGVECSDGEERCVYDAVSASFCVMLTPACGACVQDGSTALLTACANGHVEVAQWLVSSAGSNPVTEMTNVGLLS